MDDCLIIGGGVIGLSLAYQLARDGARVRVIDRGETGREASWAGAGMLPPAKLRPTDDPYQQLAGLAIELQPQWAAMLREETGLDNGYRRTGALYVAYATDSEATLRRELTRWTAAGLQAAPLSPDDVQRLEPGLAPPRYGVHLPEEAQLRNPRHLRALETACRLRGVTITAGVEARRFTIAGERVVGVETNLGTLAAGAYCVTSGAWSRGLLADFGAVPAIRPVRGQIVLLRTERGAPRHIINDGPRYLVPRDDGRVLIGSTEEDVGFDKRTTVGGVAGLLEFARALLPPLGEAQFERSWAGLRPATADGLPYLGRLPRVVNAYIAAGHFRSGLTLSPATAVVMSQLIRGLRPTIDLTPFRIDRS